MIIVSQDGKTMMNYDTAVALEVQHDDQYNDGFVIQGLYEDYCFTCGKYKTEERAKEVLKEIIEVFTAEEFFHINKSSLNNLDELAEPKYILRPVSKSKVYYMPEV